MLNSTTGNFLVSNNANVVASQGKATKGTKKRSLKRFCTLPFTVKPDLRFVLEAPDTLRLALDHKEVQAILGIGDQMYANACITGQLLSSETGRDYFEPILKFHSFWDVLRFRLFEALHIRSTDEAQLMDVFLDATAFILDSRYCVKQSLSLIFEEAYIFAEHLSVLDTTQPERPSVLSESIVGAVVLEFSGFGNYCRRRIRQGSPTILNGVHP